MTKRKETTFELIRRIVFDYRRRGEIVEQLKKSNEFVREFLKQYPND